jgi:ribulose bisphosphate carboxylase small subunit
MPRETDRGVLRFWKHAPASSIALFSCDQIGMRRTVSVIVVQPSKVKVSVFE